MKLQAQNTELQPTRKSTTKFIQGRVAADAVNSPNIWVNQNLTSPTATSLLKFGVVQLEGAEKLSQTVSDDSVWLQPSGASTGGHRGNT
jgi:hypothetical protein